MTSQESGAPGSFADGSLGSPAGSKRLDFSHDGLVSARRLVAAEAARAGLTPERASDFVAAVSELAANSVLHGGGRGTLRVWREDGALLAEVRDGGWIKDPMVGRVRPTPTQEGGGRGLWMVNQLCDVVQIWSGPAGTGVRLRMSLG